MYDNPAWWLVFSYSEWLDQQKLVAPQSDADPRTHADLVNEFMEWCNDK